MLGLLGKMVSIAAKYMKSVNMFGLRGTLMKLYTNGDVKFGNLVGKDHNGNEYFENAVDYPYGQHRWVENMENPHDFCPTMIPPRWHSWLHSMTDYLPDDPKAMAFNPIITTEHTSNDSTDHVGGVDKSLWEGMHNTTGHTDRGYGFGSRYSEFGEGKEYQAPGHILNRHKRADEYEPNRTTTEMWQPGNTGDEGKKPVRPLSEE